MRKTKDRRRNITLIEIIVVMFFITIITGVIAYNVKGALDEGRAFKTLEGIKQIETILSMELANDSITPEDIENGSFVQKLDKHPLVKNWNALLKDGWGVPYTISYDHDSDVITVSSKKFDTYQADHPTLFKKEK